MDGENSGKSYEQMDHLGVFPRFLVQHPYIFFHTWYIYLHLVDYYGFHVGKYTIVPWILWFSNTKVVMKQHV